MISYIRGYYVVVIEGIELERFLNHLSRNNIRLYNIKREKLSIECCIDREDFKKFKKIHKNNNYKIKIKQKVGLPFIAIRIYKNKVMLISAILSFFIFFITSQFVTDIYIEVPEGIKKEEIRKELYNIGLKPGTYKKNIDRKKIRDEIMLKFDDVAYVSINVKGTNIFVTITKKAETLSESEKSNYCNIISTKDAIIEKVIARSGNAVVSEGDIVKSGDILIKGADTKSLPEVWANTFYEVEKSESYEEVIKEKTGNKKRVYTIKFYDKEYTIRRKIDYKDYTIENKEYDISIKNYTFPVKIKVSTFYETKDKKVTKDKDELKEKLQQESLNELNYIIPPSARYKDVSYDYKVEKNMLKYIITVHTLENIVEVKNLSKSEAENMILELNNSTEEQVPSNPEKRPINDIRNELDIKEEQKQDEKLDTQDN